MSRQEQSWKKFAITGDPMQYLEFTKNRHEHGRRNNNQHENHKS